MPEGFIKLEKLKILEESNRSTDLLDFTAVCKRFTKKISAISGASIVALVGPFGSGKSTMLNKVMQSRGTNEFWVEFDAWKYPDRKDLWEGFVLDLAKTISPKEFEKADKKIKGTLYNDVKTLIKTLARVPGLGALEGVTHFFETSPAKRVDDIQKIIHELIGKFDKDLFIVIEDIDRSGDAGIFFLETLKQFFSSHTFSNKLIAIAPMANDNYERNIDSYLKCVDYFEFFETYEVKLESFVSETFDPALFEGNFKRQGDNRVIWTGIRRKSQTVSFLQGIFHEMPGTTMRLLKLIIRKANLVYGNQKEDGHDPDFRVTLCLEASKYFSVVDGDAQRYFNSFKKRKCVTRGNVFASYLMAMLGDRESIYIYGLKEKKDVLVPATYDFNFIERKDDSNASYPSYPWAYGHFEDNGYGLPSFYLDY